MHPDTQVLIEEDVAAALHHYANDNMVDLVVLSAHGHTGRQQWAVGSLVTSFLTHGTTSILIMQDMPGHATTPIKFESETHTWKEAGLRATLSTSTQGEPGFNYDRTAN